MIYFILVDYKKLAKKLGKEYLKSENIANLGRFFSLAFCCRSLWDYQINKSVYHFESLD